MIPQYPLSVAEAAALRERDETRLAQLRRHIRAWVFEGTNSSATAWQIQGLPLRAAQLGSTPLPSSGPMSAEAAGAAQIVEWLARCLGECVTFPGMKQADQNVQQVFPVPGFENRQSAASSLSPLTWHTEHADKESPPDFLVIACLRNHDGIGTRLSRPDLSHLGGVDATILSMPMEFKFETRIGSLKAMAVVDQEGLRYDPVYCTPLSERSRHAFQRLAEEVDRKAIVAFQEPGAALIIPNRHTVHARESFQARYDGTDRWLMRAMVRR